MINQCDKEIQRANLMKDLLTVYQAAKRCGKSVDDILDGESQDEYMKSYPMLTLDDYDDITGIVQQIVPLDGEGITIH